MDTEKLIEKTREALQDCIEFCGDGRGDELRPSKADKVLEAAFAEVRMAAERSAYGAVARETRALIANKQTYQDRNRALDDIALFAEARERSALLPPAAEEKVQCDSVSFGGCRCELEHGHGGPHEADNNMKRWQQ